MRSSPQPAFVTRVLALFGVVFATLGDAEVALAAPIVATAPVADAFGVVGAFETTEPHLYFAVPRELEIERRGWHSGAMLSAVAGGPAPTYDLRLVLTLGFDGAAPTLAQVRAADPDAMLAPLPMAIESLSLDLPTPLGTIVAALEPTLGASTPVLLYYRLRLTEAQLATFRQLANGPLALTGSLVYRYLMLAGEQATALPFTIDLDPEDLVLASTSPTVDRGVVWLRDLLATRELDASGVADGPVALGGGFDVTISQSRLVGEIVPAAIQVTRIAPTRFACRTVANATSFAGTLDFFIDELATPVSVEVEASLDLELEILDLSVTVPRFEPRLVTVDGAASPFFQQLLSDWLKKPETRARLSREISRELRRRILEGTLFTL